MMSKPFVLIISGVAGSGKDTLLEELWQHPDLFEIAVSCTDRPIRLGEIEGKNYHYITKEQFDAGIKKREFIEWETVRGKYRYGRKKTDLKKAFKTGKTVVMSAEPLGMMKFKKLYDVASVFIMPPSLEVAIERLKKRGNDTAEGLKDRTERYKLELSYKDKYDHVIINDDLETARRELLRVAKLERENHRQGRIVRKTLFGLLAIFLLAGSAFAYNYSIQSKQKKNTSTAFPPGITGENSNSDSTPTVVTPPSLPSAEVKKKVVATPPKKPTAEKISSSTTKNSDGSTTTTISTGGVVSQTDLAKLYSSTATINSPLDVAFIDETGNYAALGGILDNYLNSTLKWRNEISALKGIIIENVGATGWNGQYLGSYVTSNTGQIISSAGVIVLNAYYIETQYCAGGNNFDGCPNEYAKLFLSHEYGHHYTLYHKWMDWNLPIGTRFPDSYYTVRPLSKTTTATDYSLGWSNCEVEIIAEDYSYLYSGYGLQAMHTIYGYPSTGTKTWLDNIGSASELTETTVSAESTPPTQTSTSPPPTDSTVSGTPTDTTNPTIVITAPTTNPYALAGNTVNVSAAASDDIAVGRIELYFNDQFQQSWQTASLSLLVSFKNLNAGTYTLKFKTFDTSGNSAETTLTVVKS